MFGWTNFWLLTLGVLTGAIVGILPGLGGAATIALLIPFVARFEPTSAFAVLMGIAAVTATTGDLTSILIGVPGEATTAATVLDGHPMTRRGEASRAIGASLASSLAGTIIGALTLAFTIPFAGIVARSIGSPELFMLALFGMTFVAPLTGSTRLKGVAAGGLGFMLAMVGLDALSATPRFTFGRLALWDGVGAVPVVLGLFAIPEIVELAAAEPAASSARAIGGRRVWTGVTEAGRLWPLILRSSAIGAAIGVLPGVGATVSQWIAYGHAARRSARPEEFGHGSIEGVIAPSAANNATLGGALAPMFALGLPGGLTSAMLLTAMVMMGLVPGPGMLLPESQGGHLTFVFALAWFMVIGNVIAVILCFAAADSLIAITRVRAERLVPFLLIVTFLGAFTERFAMTDVLLTCALGACGLAFVRYGWPRVPVLLGLTLGPLAENRLFLSFDAYGSAWLLRPGVLVVAAVMLIGFVMPSGRSLAPRAAAPSTAARQPMHPDEPVFTLFLIVLLVAAEVACASYPSRASFMPRIVAAVTMAVLVLATWVDLRTRPRVSRRVQKQLRVNPALGLIPLFVLLIWLLGFIAAAPLVVLGTVVTGRERLSRAVLFAAATYVVVDVVLVRVLDVPLPPGALSAWFARAH